LHPGGGEDVSVRSLLPADADAHVLEPKPADLRAVQGVQVLIENGLGLEGWMTRMPRAAGFKGQLITASQNVAPSTILEDGRRVVDPHAWQDPRNGVLYVRVITDALAAAAPNREAVIHARSAAYISRIEETDRWIADQLATIPTAKRLTSHHAFGYYCARYGITLRSIQGVSTEGEPSAREIARLIELVRRERIRAVFIENMASARLTQAVAREAGAVIGDPLYADALSPPDGPAPSYLAMLRHNTTLFAAAMATNPG
jgi:zinc/manganese transport system substrate-binding protein